MIDVKQWIKELGWKLEAVFGDRLVFIGLQGSYGRGEAREDSDIDVVVILDELEPEDIDAYDHVLSKMSHRDLVCGFLSGRAELELWESSELFQLCFDTISAVGSLEFLLHRLDESSVRRAIHTGACGLYHGCVHNLLHEKDERKLMELYKTAFFTARALHYDRTGRYLPGISELAEDMEGEDREILRAFTSLKSRESIWDFRELSVRLFTWSKGLLLEYAE